ncbi:MAG: M20/M25/M40 family metallo-hydrolase [Bdellovibrionota bacterium]
MMINAANNAIQDFVVSEYQHTNITFIEQNSVIAKIPGTDPNAGTIIIGAHLDSINLENKNNAPGADDDASGVAVLIETIRNIASSKAQFRHDIEFHAYAAEEVGLVGSRDIAEAYNTQNKKIAAMMQLDMVSWSSDPSDTTIYLVENDTSSNLRREVKNLLTAYLNGNYGEMALKAGTSDHKSWNSLGFKPSFLSNILSIITKHFIQKTIPSIQ